MIAQYLDALDLRALPTAGTVLHHFDRFGAWFFQWINRFVFDWQRPPENQQLADVLDDASAQFIGQLVQHGRAGFPVVHVGADLNEPVGAQRCMDFSDHCGSQTVRTDGDNGLQVVGLGAKLAAFGGGQWQCTHACIILCA